MTALIRSCLLALLAFSLPHPLAAAKVVFISGKPSHGPMAHEHRAGNLLLAKALREADLGIETVVLPKDGYPEDPSVFQDADTVVVFCTGHEGHLLNPHLEAFDGLMKKGTGVVMIHWATEAQMGPPAKKFLEWMGGYCDPSWSVNPHWTPHFKSFPDHPIANGVQPFSLNDEWYYHMRFVPDLKGVTPILSDVPGPETLTRPDGLRSGNPDVRRAVANGESQCVAWAYERPDGKGRGFGFTGAHNHKSWKDDNFRKVVLNAILWTAHVEVPEAGTPSKTPTDDELKQNLDDKPKRKKPAPAVRKPAAAVLEADQPRQMHAQKMNSRQSLVTLVKAVDASENPTHQKALISGMILGLEGQRDVAPPEGWAAVSAKLAKSDDSQLKKLTQQLSQVFGDESATLQAIATLKDKTADLENRRSALASLLIQQRQELPAILKPLLDEEALRIEAIRGFSNFEIPEAGPLLLGRYPTFEPAAQRAIIETLATRKKYAESLFQALEARTLSKEAIPAYAIRSLGKLLGTKFTQKYGVVELNEDKESLIAEYMRIAAANGQMAGASASLGRVVFQKACMACHQMYGEGGIIGPDLTGSNRADLNYLLLNIIDPSGDIPDAYRMVTVTTKNGQVLAGSVTEEDDQRVVLSMVGQKTTVAKSDIKSRETSDVSMMPEGLLKTLTPEEVLNLFKYMQTKEQVALPKP
ncbi:ThuA domain-containing protein [Prosthecobacter sp. SYSU 5D2]|uniref:ThuA domain-containing protein n=1 Tax=Prosthecobacter sp. SYSU 5D2 TaxID=3134134 RepID=UPI0031FEFC19